MLSNYQAVGIYEGFYDGSREDVSDSIELIADEFIHDTCLYLETVSYTHLTLPTILRV